MSAKLLYKQFPVLPGYRIRKEEDICGVFLSADSERKNGHLQHKNVEGILGFISSF